LAFASRRLPGFGGSLSPGIFEWRQVNLHDGDAQAARGRVDATRQVIACYAARGADRVVAPFAPSERFIEIDPESVVLADAAVRIMPVAGRKGCSGGVHDKEIMRSGRPVHGLEISVSKIDPYRIVRPPWDGVCVGAWGVGVEQLQDSIILAYD